MTALPTLAIPDDHGTPDTHLGHVLGDTEPSTADLIRRLRLLLHQGQPKHGAVDAVLAACTEDERLLLARLGLNLLERQTLRLDNGDHASDDHAASDTLAVGVVGTWPAIPVDNTGYRKRLPEWNRADVVRWLEIHTRAHRTVGRVIQGMTVARDLLADSQTLNQVWSQLPDRVQEMLAVFGGVKRLAA
jgi:hypothetical protein